MTSMAQFIGSDVGGKYGYGVGVIKGRIHIEFVKGFHETKTRILSNRMSHVRVLFRREKTYVYLNGRKVAEFPPSKSRELGRFVIGTFGVKNSRHLFVGQIRQVRISRADNAGFAEFRPKKYMPVTENTLLLYDALSVDGTRIIDRSRNGNDGQMKGVFSQISIIR